MQSQMTAASNVVTTSLVTTAINQLAANQQAMLQPAFANAARARWCSFPPSSTSLPSETSKEEATVAVDVADKDVGIAEAGKAKAEGATRAPRLQTTSHARQADAFLPSPPSRCQECHSWEQVLQMCPTPTSLNGMPTLTHASYAVLMLKTDIL